MKKVLTLILVIMISITIYSEKVLKVVGDISYPPFSFPDQDGNPQGICVDLWKLWSKKTGIRVDYRLLPWEEAQKLVLEGKADVADFMFYSEERDKYFDFSKHYTKVTTSIYFHKDLAGIRSVEDLKGFLIGVKKGDFAVEYLKKHARNSSLIMFDTYDEILKAAKKGEIKIFVMDDPPANYYLLKYGVFEKFRKTDPIYEELVYCSVKEGNHELLKLINEGFSMISKEEKERIFNKWLKKKIFPPVFWKYLFISLMILAGIFTIVILWNRELKRRIRKATKELIDKENELNKMYTELKKKNLEVERAYSLLKEQSAKIGRIIKLISNISPHVDQNELMEMLLNTLLDVLPEFEKGRVYFRENDKRWRCIATKGYNDSLKNYLFNEEWLIIPKKEEIVVLDDIGEHLKGKLPQDILNTILDIKKSVGIGVGCNGTPVFLFFLDKTEKTDISEASRKVLKNFSKLISIFTCLKIFMNRESAYRREVINAMLFLLEKKAPFIKGHSMRVAKLSALIAKKMGFTRDEIDRIFWAGILHDIGKFGIPEKVLMKRSYTDEEMNLIRKHPQISADIVENIEHLRPLADIIRYHHERWDGKGYPKGLKGEEIPLFARILAVADTFDNLMNEYKDYRKVIHELERLSWEQLDGNVVKALLSVLEEREEV